MKKLLLAALTAGVLQGTVCAHQRAIWGLDDNVSIGYRLTDFYYVEPSNACVLTMCPNAWQSP